MRNLFLTIIFLLCAGFAFAQHGVVAGGDISMIPAYENAGNVYYNAKGEKINDLVNWLVEDCGWNAMRVRLFVNPPMSDAQFQDLDYVKKLGKRIKDAGAKFLLDLHYSDTWADPAKQYTPAAWASCTTPQQKADKIYAYTKECLQELVAFGATPDYVQVGNEITYGIVDVKVEPYNNTGDWTNFCNILSKGSKAVREICPDAQIIIHIERSGEPAKAYNFYNDIKAVDYDIIGLSYYPFYHGFLPALESTLTRLHNSFPEKKIQIVETSYFFQYFPSDAKYKTSTTWAATPDGQYSFTSDLITTLAKYDYVEGLYWWFPEECGNGDKQKVMEGWVNRGLWWPSVGGDGIGHWPVTTSKGDVAHLISTFLSPDIAGIESVTAASTPKNHSNSTYNLAGQRINPSHSTKAELGHKGLVIKAGKKAIR